LGALCARPSSALGASLVALFLLMALFGPLLAPYGLNEQISGAARQPPSIHHWFGTDNLGRDVFSRVLYGARDILLLAGLGTLLSILTGTLIGLASGYWGGWLDEMIMRLFDGLLALPALLLALLMLGALGPSRLSVMTVLVIVYTPIVARVVRSVVLAVKVKAYVAAARARAEKLPWILLREVLPATFPALAVEASMRFSYAIFLVASLGFLGVGVQPPSPDWGLMVKEARIFITQTPWALYFPAGAIALVVVGMNLMTDGLRRALQAPERFGA
jgi:peptide/nickel transport system permease protein